MEIGIGIESANETIRTVLLNKGYSLGDVEKKIKILEKYNVGLLSYVLVKPPGVKEHEAIKDAIHTAKYSFTLGARHNVRTRVALQPFFVPKGSIAEIEYKKGNYKLLKLWSIIEIIKKINYLGSISVALNDESLSDGLVASNCKLCNSGIIAALRKYNCTNNLKFLSDLDCSCKTL